jgi:geranylgeranyl pyrophosphate synthase
MVGNRLGALAPARAISTTELFAPVREGLAAVEARLHEVAQNQHPALTAATDHLLSAGGKRVRPALVLLAAGMFSADWDQSVALAAAVEMLHTATLVHDDLIDGALLRRGVPTLNVDWTPDVTVLTGDYLFARAASLVAQTHNTRIIDRFSRTLMVIVNGEIKQKFSKGLVSRRDYYERIYAKTAALFRLSTESAAMLGDADEASLEALGQYGWRVGMAFQIVDDVFDFVGTPDKIGKPVGGDLRQGLFTLPAIYYVQDHPYDPDVKALLDGDGADQAIVSRVVAAVSESNAIDKTLEEAHQFVAQAQLALNQLPGSDCREALWAVSEYIVQREV